MPKMKYQGEENVYTYVYLKECAQIHLLQCEGTEEGNLYTSMSSLVFSAFTIEAYLNHLGVTLFENWEEIEKDLKTKEKLKKICLKLNFIPDFSRRPFQAIKKLFNFRNKLAHGRTQKINGTWSEDSRKNTNKPLNTAWKNLCIPKEARNCYDDMVSIVEILHEKAGKGIPPFAILSEGGSIGRLPEVETPPNPCQAPGGQE